jgi:outer membrane lipoprotein-sorting protein
LLTVGGFPVSGAMAGRNSVLMRGLAKSMFSTLHRQSCGALAIGAIVVLALTALAWTQRADADSANTSSMKSSAVYKHLVSRYGALKSYQATIQSVAILQPVNGSKPNTIDTTLNVSYEAPNLFRIDAQGLMGGGVRVSDGKTLYTYSAMLNQYTTEPAPKKALSELISLLASAPALDRVGQEIVNGVQTTQYAGTSATDHGKLRYEVFIDSKTQLIQRLVITGSALPGPQGSEFRLILREDYTSQKLNPKLTRNLFHFAPPPGAERSQTAQMPSIMGIPG